MPEQKETLKDKVMSYAEKNKNPTIDSISIVNLGGIGCGKTTLVSRVHSLFGYCKPGFTIESGRYPTGGTYGKPLRDALTLVGFRKGSTATLDHAIIYGYTPKGIIQCNFYAPAGHSVRVDVSLNYEKGYKAIGTNLYVLVEDLKELFLPKTIDGLIYLVDGSLQRTLEENPSLLNFKNLLMSCDTYFDRLSESQQYLGTTLCKKPFGVFVFKGEGIYAQLRSFLMIDKILEKYLGDIPIINARTHMPYNLLHTDTLAIEAFQNILNEHLQLYKNTLQNPPEQYKKKKIKKHTKVFRQSPLDSIKDSEGEELSSLFKHKSKHIDYGKLSGKVPSKWLDGYIDSSCDIEDADLCGPVSESDDSFSDDDTLFEAHSHLEDRLRPKQKPESECFEILRQKVKQGYFPLNHQLNFFHSTDDWKNIDLLEKEQRVAVVQLFYDICVRALQSKNVDVEGFKLLSFSNSPVFGEMVINYRELINH